VLAAAASVTSESASVEETDVSLHGVAVSVETTSTAVEETTALIATSMAVLTAEEPTDFNDGITLAVTAAVDLVAEQTSGEGLTPAPLLAQVLALAAQWRSKSPSPSMRMAMERLRALAWLGGDYEIIALLAKFA
jgi:hypothetical protein